MESGQRGIDEIATRKLVEQAFGKLIRDSFDRKIREVAGPIIRENAQLRSKLADSQAEIGRLQNQNAQLLSLAENALTYIQQLRASQNRDLLVGLNITNTDLNDPTKREEVEKALTRAARFVHPNAHPTEPPLVQRILTRLSLPLTRALDTLKRPTV